MIDDQPPVPEAAQTSAVRPRLWNPNAAANWSLLFSPIFGACLHAANWRALGQPRRAAANVAWAWAGVAFVVVVLASVFLPESVALEQGLQYGGVGLVLGWYFTQGRPQARFVRDTHGDEYDRRGWGVPLLAGVVGWVAYFGSVMAALTALAAFRPISAPDLAEQLQPLIQMGLCRDSGSLDIRVRKVTLVHQGGDTYTGTADATVAGRPQKYTLQVVNSRPTMEWRAHPEVPDFGTLISYKNYRLYYTYPVTAAEANALGEHLSACGFFNGTGKLVQLTKSFRAYQFCTPVSQGFEQDPATLKVLATFARELSEGVFRSAPTEVHLCDANLITLNVLPAE